MLFGYTLEEASKAVISFVFLAGAVLALVLSNYDPSFTTAVIGLVGPVFGLVGVFMAKNHTIDDLSKAVTQLQGAALFVVGYFATVSPGTGEQITVLVGAALSVYAVFKIRNGSDLTRSSVLSSSRTPGP